MGARLSPRHRGQVAQFPAPRRGACARRGWLLRRALICEAEEMYANGGRRTNAQRDAATIEIGYALVSAAFAAAVLFGALAGPALLFDLPHPLSKTLLRLGMVVAPVVFMARVVSVLVRFRQESQPSQPGRTNPDS